MRTVSTADAFVLKENEGISIQPRFHYEELKHQNPVKAQPNVLLLMYALIRDESSQSPCCYVNKPSKICAHRGRQIIRESEQSRCVCLVFTGTLDKHSKTRDAFGRDSRVYPERRPLEASIQAENQQSRVIRH